jgi:hypothetical protein
MPSTARIARITRTTALTRNADVDRTLRAALLAAFIGFASVAGLGIFLGFDLGASMITGAVAGLLVGLLIFGAARRADTFHDDTPPPPVEPGFPGPPEPSDDRRSPEDEHGSASAPDDDHR